MKKNKHKSPSNQWGHVKQPVHVGICLIRGSTNWQMLILNGLTSFDMFSIPFLNEFNNPF